MPPSNCPQIWYCVVWNFSCHLTLLTPKQVVEALSPSLIGRVMPAMVCPFYVRARRCRGGQSHTWLGVLYRGLLSLCTFKNLSCTRITCIEAHACEMHAPIIGGWSTEQRLFPRLIIVLPSHFIHCANKGIYTKTRYRSPWCQIVHLKKLEIGSLSHSIAMQGVLYNQSNIDLYACERNMCLGLHRGRGLHRYCAGEKMLGTDTR
jgi:hypothetical protein